jgi:hypothetical protein
MSAAARSRTTTCRCGPTRSASRRCRRARCWTAERHQRARHGRGGGAQPRQRAVQSERAAQGQSRNRAVADRAHLRLAAAPSRLPADHRRRLGDDHRLRGRGRALLQAPGLGARHRPSHGDRHHRRARSHALALDADRRGEGRCRARQGGPCRAARAVQPPGDHPAPRARAGRLRTGEPLGRSARWQHDDGGGPGSHRLRGRAASWEARPIAAWRMRPRDPACSRTWSRYWRLEHGKSRGSGRSRPDQTQIQAQGRLDRRAGAPGGRARAGRRRLRMEGHRRAGARQGAGHVRGHDDARAVPHGCAGRQRQAGAPRAHGRQRGRLHRDRRGQLRAERPLQPRADGDLREAVGIERDLGAVAAHALRAARERGRRRLLRAVHAPVHGNVPARRITSAAWSR